MNWCISLKKEYADKILDGSKTIEVRSAIPKALKKGDTVYCVQCDTKGRVVLKFKVDGIINQNPLNFWDTYRKAIGMSWEYYKANAMLYKKMYGIKVCNVEKLNAPIYISDLGITRSPQWFQSVKYIGGNLK